MLFAIKIFDNTEKNELRDEFRKPHLEYLAQFDAATWFAGPFTTDDGTRELGSFRVLDLPDRAAAEKHVADEPFIREGLQYGATVHRYGIKSIYTYRDCPRTEGNVQMLVHALDGPDGLAMRKELQPAHLAFLDKYAAITIARGPMLSDDGEKPIGSAFLFDVPSMEAGRELWAEEPYTANDMFESLEIYRWRFGRIFDRLA